jgi:dTDP-3-amino-3,4,6-trideoxy-alpha-D-glucose transaminase
MTAMKVPFYDHAKLYRRRQAEIDAAIHRVVASGRLDWGDEVPAFEAEFAAFVGAAHCVTVNSGTAALKVALLGLGIGPGDEVVTVPNSDIGTTSGIHHVGATSVWVDVEPGALTMDPAAMRAAITPRTRALLPVDLFGHPAAMPEIMATAKAHGLAVVEDACLALGADIGGRAIGQWADVTCFSFSPNKHLGAYGSGGACVTDDAALAERMRKLSAYGQPRSRHRSLGTTGQPLNHETEGLNERLDEIQAAILRVRLPDLPASLATRRAQAARYDAALGSLIETPQTKPGMTHAWRNYVVHVDRRDAVREALTAHGVGTALSYAPPMHLQPVYAGKGYGTGAFPVVERSAARLLGLPIGPHLDDAQIDAAIEAVRSASSSDSRS